MWDKYRHESKQTICVIGVLILSAKLCRADGHFSEKEEEEILKIVPHETQQKKILINTFFCWVSCGTIFRISSSSFSLK